VSSKSVVRKIKKRRRKKSERVLLGTATGKVLLWKSLYASKPGREKRGKPVAIQTVVPHQSWSGNVTS